MKFTLANAISTAAIMAVLTQSALIKPALAQDDQSYQTQYSGADQTTNVYDTGTNPTDSGMTATPDIAAQSRMIQSEAQSEIIKSTSAVAVALTQLNQGPVTPEPVTTPPGLTIAAPAAPAASPLPPIDYTKLPPELARPVSIIWNGPVNGAIDQIAQQINYHVVASHTQAATPPAIVLDEQNVPAAKLFQEIGARVVQYGTVIVNPNDKTVELSIKPANQ